MSFALMAPCACRQARYASRCVAEADLEEDAGLQQRCAAALRGGALPFPPAWALAASDAAPPASYVAAVPRGALLAHALRRAARPGVDVESVLTETVSQLTDEEVVEVVRPAQMPRRALHARAFVDELRVHLTVFCHLRAKVRGDPRRGRVPKPLRVLRCEGDRQWGGYLLAMEALHLLALL